MDNKQIEHDPQQYRDEWFNLAMPPGREFQLPNINSNMPPCPHHFTFDGANFSMAQFSGQNPTLHWTYPSPLSDMDFWCHSEIQFLPFPSFASGSTFGEEAYASSLAANNFSMAPVSTTNQLCLPNFSESPNYGPSIGVLSQRPHSEANSLNTVTPGINFPVGNHQRIHVSSSLNPPFIYPSSEPVLVRNYNLSTPPPICAPIDSMNRSSSFNRGLIGYNNHQPSSHNRPGSGSSSPCPGLLSSMFSFERLGEGQDPMLEGSTSGLKKRQTPPMMSFEYGSSSGEKAQESPATKKLKATRGSVPSERHDHVCFICNASFASGSALGGHMSSHAKKNKMEAIRNGFFFSSGSGSRPRRGQSRDGTEESSSLTANDDGGDHSFTAHAAKGMTAGKNEGVEETSKKSG